MQTPMAAAPHLPHPRSGVPSASPSAVVPPDFVPTPPAVRGTLSLAVILPLLGLFLAVALPLIWTGNMQGRGAMDQINYHAKVIRTFAAQWPAPDLRDYLSATTPGYHLLLAAFARWTATTVGAWQILGASFTLGLLAVFGHALYARTRSASLALIAALPLLASMYVLQSGVWLLPDNAAWLCVLLTLILSLRIADGKNRSPLLLLVAAGVAVLALVWFRQIHIWTAGVVWAAAWLAHCPRSHPADAPWLMPGDLIPFSSRSAIGHAAFAVLVTLPAWTTLVAFYLLWDHSLVPPTFRGWYRSGLQLATPAFVLTLIALISAFFASWLWPRARSAWTRHKPALAAGAAIGLALAALGPTNPDMAAGRFSGIWHGIGMFPVLSGRTSLFIMGAAPLGALAVVAWLTDLPRRQRWIFLLTLAGFTAAQTFSVQLWQRYHEPFVLMWVALAAASGPIHAPVEVPRLRLPLAVLRLAGPLVLAALLAFVTITTISRARVVQDEGFEPGRIESPP